MKLRYHHCSVNLWAALILSCLGGVFVHGESSVAQSAVPSIQGVWQQVYQRLPDLPKENQYISSETGKPSTGNTLVGRLIRYHVLLKSRSPLYRLDWKLTLADYLGVNEVIIETTYPGREELRTNPMDRDRATINQLTRQQREALVQALVSSFNPQAPKASTPEPATLPKASPPPPRQIPAQPRPGDAELLKF
jgi:hypothetical protein